MNVQELFSLKGRVVLVTGSTVNYGACIATGLAEAGAAVIITSRNLEKSQKKANELVKMGFSVTPGQLDIADEKSIRTLKEKIISEHGRIDILVNNAVLRPGGPGMSLAQVWQESMRVNAVGLHLCTSIFLEQMAKQKKGNIINIASMYGMVAQYLPMYVGTGFESDESGDYFFHKAGMINYTRFLAVRCASDNIRVNCISPGGLFANQPERFLERYYRHVPLGRMADEDDIKGAVVYLASEASSYVTGHNLVVDGGWTIW
ncbi:MAG: SDR family oxidoreductase [Candidatus Omnitrophota bacterium]